uniref:Ependymin-like 1 n=1 Tax=Oreochromis niloticus TaxID=8128 RepID=A0A669DY67_ORENI
MKLFVVLVCVLAGCLAEKPRPCKQSCILFLQSTQNEKLWLYAKYFYDALGQKVRLTEQGNYQKKPFTYDALLLFREVTKIDDKARTCKKKPLRADFHPMEIPINSSLVGQAVLGSSSGVGQGLLVNTWTGNLSGKNYVTTFTEIGCIPVNTKYQTQEYGWVLTDFFNNVIGISDPGQLNPPDYCPTEMTANGEQSEDFTSFFFKLQ